MSVAAALTVIAIAVGVLALLAVVAVIFLMRLILHLIAFEKTLHEELGEIRKLATELRGTTERVGQAVRDVQVAARRVGGAMGTAASLVSLIVGRRDKSSRTDKLRTWMTAASIGIGLLQRRKSRKPPAAGQRKKSKPKPPKLPAGSDSSLTM